MSERLITKKEVVSRMAICMRTFEKRKPKLIALGLQEVPIGNKRRYRESSLDALIRHVSESGLAL